MGEYKKISGYLKSVRSLIPISWVLLHYGSNFSSICNYEIVDNIGDSNITPAVNSNGGSKYYIETESLRLFPISVHFNSTLFANILSLSEVESHYLVTMDTTFKSEFRVHINDHKIVKFLKCGPGLYDFDTAKFNKYPFNDYSFLSTVKDNK